MLQRWLSFTVGGGGVYRRHGNWDYFIETCAFMWDQTSGHFPPYISHCIFPRCSGYKRSGGFLQSLISPLSAETNEGRRLGHRTEAGPAGQSTETSDILPLDQAAEHFAHAWHFCTALNASLLNLHTAQFITSLNARPPWSGWYPNPCWVHIRGIPPPLLLAGS